MKDKNTKYSLSTESYKGVRDFYPEDMFVQKHLFDVMRKTVESFGFIEYTASILEPSELYKAKSGEEIVNEQTYTFKDRGDREVTLRPEMTPTVTRMVAARKRELSFPLRWYSIPNLFRYEKPQRGRLREHYQLNVDMFGVDTIDAEVEIISVAYTIMRNYGAVDQDFKISINSRKILNYLLEEVYTLTDEKAYKIMKLIDKKKKISTEEFERESQKIIGEKYINSYISLLNTNNIDDFSIRAEDMLSSSILGVTEVREVMKKLQDAGITNAVFDPTLARGFDYYTGIVFEVNDTDPTNPRSLFGGGRFDDLLSSFITDKVPAVGFGMGDVTIKDFLETHKLMPKYIPHITLALCPLSNKTISFSTELAQKIRKENINVVVEITTKKMTDQFKWAEKQSIPYIIFIGENEMNDQAFAIRELATKKETKLESEKKLIEHLKKINNPVI